MSGNLLERLVIECANCHAPASWPREPDGRSEIKHNGACQNHDELIIRERSQNTVRLRTGDYMTSAFVGNQRYPLREPFEVIQPGVHDVIIHDDGTATLRRAGY